MKALVVVKLGGSLAAAPALRGWLDAIAQGAGRVVVTPGGGPFADAVRGAQTAMGFDDVAAHRLALAAMRQYGIALCALHPAMAEAASLRAIAAGLRAGRVPVWMPEAVALAEPTIAASWDVTSDSLALWLAMRLNARAVILIKQMRPAPASATALARAGVVDLAFPAYVARATLPAYIAGPGDAEGLGVALRTGHMGGLVQILADTAGPMPPRDNRP